MTQETFEKAAILRSEITLLQELLQKWSGTIFSHYPQKQAYLTEEQAEEYAQRLRQPTLKALADRRDELEAMFNNL